MRAQMRPAADAAGGVGRRELLGEGRRANTSVETAIAFKEKGAGTASDGSANLTVIATSGLLGPTGLGAKGIT